MTRQLPAFASVVAYASGKKAAGVNAKPSDPRVRWQIRAWLDLTKEEEYRLAMYLQNLVPLRQYHAFLRDAVRLLIDLKCGNTTVLKELFPHVLTPVPPIYVTAANYPTSDSSAPVGAQFIAPKSSSMKPANDDPAITITANKSASNPTWNNLIAMAQFTGKFDGLAIEVIDYGCKNGKITESRLLPETRAALATFRTGSTTQPVGTRHAVSDGVSNDSPRKLDVPTFNAPIFDDDDEPIQLSLT